MQNPSQQTIEVLLKTIEQDFYTKHQPHTYFYRDKKSLTYTITWPAKWMKEKHLYCPQKRYQQLITKKLKNITKHGDPQQWKPYFPRYLLKTLQDHFHHNYDQLYYEFAHVRNTIERLKISQNHRSSESQNIETLAQTHTIIAQQYRSKNKKIPHQQLKLF